MKTNKSYKEAILRAYPTKKENTQDQEKLLHLKQQSENTTSASDTDNTPVVETHKNLLRSWLNLRGLDQNLAEGKRGQKNSEKEK
ncbi:hypothetical protein ABID22_000688 [Pontibacter aydingkolensis]|uniref:Transposase n=1 Tax=Pontibacter aydingkolensis TaxID=1911536 RepID=A0ABS7CSG1_9BACT|nr:hypothetical protein [Pontibacter aydingkolensis]MBW7466437.1 hypothetical protein [Pontibacter aydingkolensis]